MERKVTHEKIIEFHKEIAERHKEINGFYRFDLKEIEGQMRSGIKAPALLLMSHSSVLSTNPNKTTNFNTRTISFLIIDNGGKLDNYVKHNEVLNATELIALDVISYCKRESNNSASFLYNLFDVANVRIEKVGPVFGTYFGWNVIYDIKNHESMVFDESKWDF